MATTATKVPAPVKKRGSNRNRKAGHDYELQVRDKMIEIGFVHTVSTRSESRSRDAQKIDLINKDERINGRLPYNIQCKNVCGRLKYNVVLDLVAKTKDVINVVLHNLTCKSANGKFITQGQYAILSQADFLAMAKRILELEKENAFLIERSETIAP